jgi:hypothetical protein
MSNILINPPEFVNKEVKFIVGDFQCTVTYMEDPVDKNAKLRVEMVHQISFLIWAGLFDYDNINDVKFNSKLLDLSPNTVFGMFDDYSRGIMYESVIFKFPTHYKSASASMCIEIILVASGFRGETFEDRRMIILAPREIGFEDRNDKKFEQLHSVVDSKIRNISNDFENKLLKMEDKNKSTLSSLDSAVTEMTKLSETLITHTELITVLTYKMTGIVKMFTEVELQVRANHIESNNKINALESKNDALDLEINGLECKNDATDLQISELKSQIAKLESEKAIERITQLESQIAKLELEKATVERIAQLESRIATLEAKG